MHDLLGINNQFNPRFLRKYLNLYDDIKGAVESYIKDVKNVDFPNENEQY
jgi:3-methyl-2-oxobutanoate hydroxymethyltransferase